MKRGEQTNCNRQLTDFQGGFPFVYLWPRGNGKPQFSWLVWVIRGVLYGGLMALFGIIERIKSSDTTS